MRKVTLQTYEEVLREQGLLVQSYVPEDQILVGSLTYDSRDLGDKALFVCKGAAFKEAYLKEVIAKGIAGYVSEVRYEDVDPKVPYLIVSDIRRSMPYLASLYYDHPDRELTLIGITGTKGKSTTSYYIKYILDAWQTALEEPETAIISSIDTYDGVESFESHLTTPEVMEVNKHLRHAADSGIHFMEMEVSSQGLKYDRVEGLTYDVGVFLNISEDHISPLEHPTMDDYFYSKLKLFDQTRHAVVNLDSDRVDEVLEASKHASDRMTFSQVNPEADLYGYDVKKEKGMIRFRVRTKDWDESFALTMPGLFNVENALAAIAVSLYVSVPMEYIKLGLLHARSSGRMEVYTSDDQRVICIVDYAHNKLSFEKLFDSTKKEYPGYDIVSIYGCPGLKALLRRKDLAEVAVRYASKIYVCAEDPGLEPFDHIVADMLPYIEPSGCDYEVIEDRGEAIRKAIMSAKRPSVLLITGKGNETRQKYGAEYLPCESDVNFVKRYLKEYDTVVQNHNI